MKKNTATDKDTIKEKKKEKNAKMGEEMHVVTY